MFEGMFVIVFLFTFVVAGFVFYTVMKGMRRTRGMMNSMFDLAEQRLTEELNKNKPITCSHCSTQVQRAAQCSNCGAPLPR